MQKAEKTNLEEKLSVFPIPEVEKSEIDEHEIWERFKRGDDKSLVRIYKTYSKSLYNYGCQFTSRTDFVKDCIQELFYSLIQKREKLTVTKSIKAYLFISIRNNILRGLKKEELVSLNEEGFNIQFQMAVVPFNIRLEDDEIEIINSKLNELPPNQKEIVLLYFYEGLSYSEISSIMNIKVKSARALLYRALSSLQKNLVSFRFYK